MSIEVDLPSGGTLRVVPSKRLRVELPNGRALVMAAGVGTWAYDDGSTLVIEVKPDEARKRLRVSRIEATCNSADLTLEELRRFDLPARRAELVQELVGVEDGTDWDALLPDDFGDDPADRDKKVPASWARAAVQRITSGAGGQPTAQDIRRAQRGTRRVRGEPWKWTPAEFRVIAEAHRSAPPRAKTAAVMAALGERGAAVSAVNARQLVARARVETDPATGHAYIT